MGWRLQLLTVQCSYKLLQLTKLCVLRQFRCCFCSPYVSYAVCDFTAMFATLFVTQYQDCEKMVSYSCYHETSNIDGQWLGSDAIKFTT